jgi:hypothetical protein
MLQAVDLELTMETILSMQLADDHQILPSMLSLLKNLLLVVLDSNQSKAEITDDNSGSTFSQLYFSVELCCQICGQIIENNRKTKAQELRTNEASRLTEELVQRCVESLESAVQATLATKTVNKDDPFNQFMQAVDAAGQEKPGEQADEGEGLAQ